LAEREEISRGLAADLSFRAIATGFGRSPSTVSREVRNNGGRGGYRAAWSRAQRSKPTKLSRLPGLAVMVEEKLEQRWSLQQILGWLEAWR
jgi:IS30 family transposase